MPKVKFLKESYNNECLNGEELRSFEEVVLANWKVKVAGGCDCERNI